MTSSVAAADLDRASPLESPPTGFQKVVANGSRGCCPSFASPWRPSFGFSVDLSPSVPVVAAVSATSGEGLGGGYCTPPNRRDVSEANSFFLLRFRSNFRVIHRLGLCFKCSVCSCVPRARSLYAPPRKVRNSTAKVRNSTAKVRNSTAKVKQKQLDYSPLKVRNSGLKVKQKQLDESPLKVRNSTAKGESKNSLTNH